MDKCDAPITDESSLAQALAKLNEAMRPSLGGSTDPARRRVAQRLAQLARCEDDDLPAFAKRHMPGRTVEGSGLRSARDLLLAIGGIADMEEGGPDAWAALAEVNRILERRLAEAKEAALKRKAEAEQAAAGPPPHVAPMLSQRMPAPLASPTPPLADATLPPTRLPPAPGALPFASTTSPLPFAARAGWDRPTPPSSAPRYDSVLPFRPPPSPAVAPREERASMAPELASWRAPPQPAWAAPSSGPGAAASISPLTLEQYAGMVVACELYPLHAQSTQSRYGVRTPDERAALDRFWHARLSADPVLAEHWERMRENARRYFRQAP